MVDFAKENKYNRFRKEIEQVINKHSLENQSDTPDFVLAEYLKGCLKAFDKAVNARSDFYKGQQNNS